MIKATIVLIALAVIAIQAEPLRRRTTQRKFLARQEESVPPSPAPTGYPEAGVTPAVPFELPNSTSKPDATYLPPDNTYGPPEVAPESEAEGEPGAVYGPPTGDEEEAQVSPAVEAEAPIETDDIKPEVESSVDEEVPQPDVKTQEDTEEEDIIVAVAEDGSVIAVASSTDQIQGTPARIYQRFPQARRRQTPVPERLVLVNPKRFSYQFMQRNWQ